MCRLLFLSLCCVICFTNCSKEDIPLIEEELPMEELPLETTCELSPETFSIVDIYVHEFLYDFIFQSDQSDPYFSYRDSMYLPKQLREDLTLAMGMIHDLGSPESDSIFNVLDFQPAYNYWIEDFGLVLNPELDWVKNLLNDVSPTGYDEFDAYVDEFDMVLIDTSENVNAFFFEYDVSTYGNPMGIGEIMDATLNNITGPIVTWHARYMKKKDQISFEIFPDRIQLSLKVGHGDCSSECTELTTWVFDFYPEDCIVEYVDRYDE